MALHRGCLDWPLYPAYISLLINHGPVCLEHKDLLVQASPSLSQATVLRSLFTQAPWPSFEHLCESVKIVAPRPCLSMAATEDMGWLAGERGESCFLRFPHIGRIPTSAHVFPTRPVLAKSRPEC